MSVAAHCFSLLIPFHTKYVMKNIKFFSAIVAVAVSSSVLTAREYIKVDFEKESGYKNVGVYDAWEQSPFRTGMLKGNCAIVNSNGMIGADNYTVPERVLGAQRSRFGSNTFGARIFLTDSFTLAPDYKYVHVIMNRPVSGRVMLIGIGGSTYFPSNGNNVEQFWETSLNSVKPNEWTDAVFAVKGFSNSSVNSLVIVPECESPHNRNFDYPFYIAHVAVNDSPRPLINYENYKVAAGSRKDSLKLAPSGAEGILRALTFSTGYGEETFTIPQERDRLLYREILNDCVSARPGEIISVTADCADSTHIDAYVYVDWNSDGVFSYGLNDNGVPDAMSEVMSYSFASNRNSVGQNLISRPEVITLPSFKIPENINPGVYRMRVNIDCNCVDPAGSNDIDKIGGSITDIMLNIVNNTITVSDNQLNGEILACDGSKLNKYPAQADKGFNLIMAPEKGFQAGGVTVRYGHLSADSIIMENPQYFEKNFIFSDSTFTIPAKYMRGSILVMGQMIEQNQ